MTVVSLADILAVGAVVEAEVVDKGLMGAVSVLTAGFLSLVEVEVFLIAEVVSLTD